jgi:TonB family protein
LQPGPAFRSFLITEGTLHEIERDLIRWPGGKWIAVVCAVVAVQVGLLLWASQKPLVTRVNYPNEPKVALALGSNKLQSEWLDMENPFLFAAASHNGFSGEAWLRQPKWQAPEPVRRKEPKFLQNTEAERIVPRTPGEETFALVQRHQVRAQLPEAPTTPSPARESRLLLAAFGGRTVVTPVALPMQYHNDVLAPTVVEAMIDRDGLVISTRIIENSGSAKADAEAIALAKRVRFVPAKSRENLPESGKLIFDWFALDLSATNGVKR